MKKKIILLFLFIVFLNQIIIGQDSERETKFNVKEIFTMDLIDYNKIKNEFEHNLITIDGNIVVFVTKGTNFDALTKYQYKIEKHSIKEANNANIKEILTSVHGYPHVLADYYSEYGSPGTIYIPISKPDIYNFEVDKIATYKTTYWYRNGVLVETDNSGFWAYDPDYNCNCYSGVIELKAKIYDSNGNYEETHMWIITVESGEIRVTNPTNNTKWQQGEDNVDIEWETGNIGGDVKIELYKGSANEALIKNSTPNDGSYSSWDVPEIITPANTYRVKVTSLNNGKYDYSDYFEIKEVKSYLEVDAELMPLYKMEDYWSLYVDGVKKASGTGTLIAEVSHGNHNYYGVVKLGNYSATTKTYSEDISIGTTGHGDAYWNKVKIEVTVDGTAITSNYSLDVNSQSQNSPLTYTYIAEKSSNVPITVCYNGQCQTNYVNYSSFGIGTQKFPFISGDITITKPNSGTKWTQGQDNVDIEWDTGNIGGNVKIELYRGTNTTLITSLTANDGIYDTWDVPSNFTPSSDYRIKVTSLSNGKSDFSDLFEIIEEPKPELTIVNPDPFQFYYNVIEFNENEQGKIIYDLFIVKNTGTGELEINNITLTESGDTEDLYDASITTPKSFTLNQNDSQVCSLKVGIIRPQNNIERDYSLTINISSNAGDVPGYFTVDRLTSINELLDEIPSKFNLLQNYPNPFNPTTTMKFGLPEESIVKLDVFNIEGSIVDELVTGKNLRAGTYTYNFDGSNLSSGVYFYVLSAQSLVSDKSFRKTGKMLLLK